jgi:hypothetical protein
MKERVLRFKDYDINENYNSLSNHWGNDSFDSEFNETSHLVELSEREFISMFDGDSYVNEAKEKKEEKEKKKEEGAIEAMVKSAKKNPLVSDDIPEITPKWDDSIEEYMKKRGNHFRGWVNKYDPEYAKSIDLDPEGKHNNAYIKKAWEKYGLTYFRILVRSKKIKEENKKKARALAVKIGMRLTKPNWGKTKDGNTVTGGLFDFNDKRTYEAVKNAKNMVINGVKYTCIQIGEGMKSYAEWITKTNIAIAKSAGNFLLKTAEYTGKFLVFVDNAIYVMAEKTVNGLVSLASSMWGYAKKGAVVVGNTIAAAFRNVNEFFVKTGGKIKEALKAGANFVTDAAQKVMKGLYTVAKGAAKGVEAIAALTVSAYNGVKKFFGNVTDFAKKCIYDVAKGIGQTAVKVGTSVKEFYDAAVEKSKAVGKSIFNTVKAGFQKAKNFAANAWNKTKNYASKVKNTIVSTYKKVQDKVVNTAKEVGSHVVAFFGGLFSSNEYQEGGKTIFESYVEFGNGERFYVPLGETKYNYNENLV